MKSLEVLLKKSFVLAQMDNCLGHKTIQLPISSVETQQLYLRWDLNVHSG